MFKKSLIATALVLSTLGAFAQAPATPVIPATATTTAKPSDVAKEKHDEMRKAKHEAETAKHEAAKAKHDEMKAKHEAEKAKRDELKARHEAEKAKHAEAKAAHAKEAAEKGAKPVKPEVPAKQ